MPVDAPTEFERAVQPVYQLLRFAVGAVARVFGPRQHLLEQALLVGVRGAEKRCRYL